MSEVSGDVKLTPSGELCLSSSWYSAHTRFSHPCCQRRLRMSHQLLLYLVLVDLIMSATGEESLEARRTSLAQLPLEKLLHVKQNLGSKHNYNKGETAAMEVEEETALPYRSDLEKKRRNKPTRRGDPWADETADKGKDVSSIFQLTVTVLSFLAFGGYLLCLLCQALKIQQPTAVPGTGTGVVTMVPTAAPAAFIGKKKRRRRSAEESMMRTLHLIAEGYAAYSLGEK